MSLCLPLGSEFFQSPALLALVEESPTNSLFQYPRTEKFCGCPLNPPNLLISKNSRDSLKSKNLDMQSSELSHRKKAAAFQNDQGQELRLRMEE